MVAPKLIRRQCGGWLAVSPSTEEVKIGVTGSSEIEAEDRYRVALARWRALEVNGAASTRTTDPTSEQPQRRP